MMKFQLVGMTFFGMKRVSAKYVLESLNEANNDAELLQCVISLKLKTQSSSTLTAYRTTRLNDQ